LFPSHGSGATPLHVIIPYRAREEAISQTIVSNSLQRFGPRCTSLSSLSLFFHTDYKRTEPAKGRPESTAQTRESGRAHFLSVRVNCQGSVPLRPSALIGLCRPLPGFVDLLGVGPLGRLLAVGVLVGRVAGLVGALELGPPHLAALEGVVCHVGRGGRGGKKIIKVLPVVCGGAQGSGDRPLL
jgi:hypothetical protein